MTTHEYRLEFIYEQHVDIAEIECLKQAAKEAGIVSVDAGWTLLNNDESLNLSAPFVYQTREEIENTNIIKTLLNFTKKHRCVAVLWRITKTVGDWKEEEKLWPVCAMWEGEFLH